MRRLANQLQYARQLIALVRDDMHPFEYSHPILHWRILTMNGYNTIQFTEYNTIQYNLLNISFVN